MERPDKRAEERDRRDFQESIRIKIRYLTYFLFWNVLYITMYKAQDKK